MAVMPLPHRVLRTFARPSAVLTALALPCAAVLAIAGCTSAKSSDPVATSPAGREAPQTGTTAVHWHSCTVSGIDMKCASLAVPLDYAHPAGRKITLALSMIPATAPQAKRQGDLLVNPGGPGGSGRYLAAVAGLGLKHAVASEYNIIGFDPRGVGASVPALHCDPSFFAGVRPDYIPASHAAERVL